MRSTCIPLAVAAALAVGCGAANDDFPREPVSGSVTLDGQPLANGNIQFLPTSETQQTGATGIIKDGEFTIPEANGPVPGKYTVSITSDSGVQPEMVGEMPGGSGTPNVDLIPEQYNTNSTLSAEVEEGGTNAFTFELQSK